MSIPKGVPQSPMWFWRTTVWPSFSPTRADFLAKVEAVVGCGVDRLALYNYGTATAGSLEWVGAAAERMGTLR